MQPLPTMPRHLAIVMDGNGRWAKKRFLPRFFGHKAGVDTLVKLIADCQSRGISYLTVYAFSSENWRRPEDEVSGLMGLVIVAVTKYLAKLAGDGVRIIVVGDRQAVSDRLRKAWDEAEALTGDNTGPSTMADAGTWCRPAAVRLPTACPLNVSTRPACRAIWPCRMRRTRIS
jgi:undecaprenyl diphosphate synthase